MHVTKPTFPVLFRGTSFIAAALLTGLTGGASAAIVASSPDDICAPSVDPCVITERVEVVAPVLDFGTRTVHVSGTAGSLDFRPVRIPTLRCGSLVVDSTHQRAIDARLPPGETFKRLTVVARRGCAADPTLACLTDADCGGEDECSAGVGAIALHGLVNGNGRGEGAGIRLVAVDDVTITRKVSLLAGISYDIGGTAGGFLIATSHRGSVTVTGRVDVSASRAFEAVAGFIELRGVDVDVDTRLKARGWVPSGGLEVVATRDAMIDGVFEFRSSSEIRVDAGRDALVGTRSRLRVRGSGLTLKHNWIRAGRDVVLSDRVMIQSNSLHLYAQESEVDVFAGRNITSGAMISANYHPMFFGGRIHMAAGENLTLSPRSHLKATSARLILEAAGDLVHRGSSIATDVRMISTGGDLLIAGRHTTRAQGGWNSRFEGCRIEVAGSILGQPNHSHLFSAREGIALRPGSRVVTTSGTNRITYRDAEEPPVIEGSISPAPELVINPALAACAD